MELPQNLLTAEDCNTILQNCFKRNNLKVASYNVKSLSDKIEGFLGEHFFVTIEYEDKESTSKSLRCFMKVLNGSSKLIFEISTSLNAYNKEEFFYTFLLNEFDKHGIDTSFAPKSYFCKPFLIVLEDLSQREFIGFLDRSRFLDLDHCKVGLRTLAKFHASGLLYESAKSSEQETPFCLLDKYPEMFQDMIFANDNNVARQWFKKSVEGIFELIPVIAESFKINGEDFQERLAQTLQKNEDLTSYLSKFMGTMLHGDVWFNNFMFKYTTNIVTESVLFDYQLLKYGPPSVDVLHFIYANTRKFLRDKHFDELIEFYYKDLDSYFPKHNLHTRLPKNEYLQLCTELKLIVKLQMICDRCVTLLVDDEAGVKADDDTLSTHLFYQNERILACFNNNAFFREVVAEDMLELYNMLIKS